ncbi:MAG: hypothetical protein M3M85_02615 [bacterium]|nr:hypothetical protein [bacterium]
MEGNTSTKFHGQINLLALFASVGLTVAFIIATYFIYTGVFNLKSGQDNLVLLMFGVLDVFGVLFVISIAASFFGYPYIVDREGLTIKKDFQNVHIGFPEIVSIKKISSEETKQIIKTVQEKDKHLYMPNTAPYISEELKNLTEYLTYNPGIGFTSRSRGISVFGVGLKVFIIKILDPLISKRNFILISLKDGRLHLLSPQSPDLFLEFATS